MGKARLKKLPNDLIDVTHLPNIKVANKARKILHAINSGEPYTTFKGKRLRYDRSVISVPVNRDFRILYKDTCEGIVPLKVLDHETYNGTKPGQIS